MLQRPHTRAVSRATLGRADAKPCNSKRAGFAIVEFAMLLPFFVILVFVILIFTEMMFRAVCLSHASFAAARRTGVASFSGTPASDYVKRHYTGCGMRGYPVVDASSSLGSNPRIQSVGVADNYTVLWPVKGGEGFYPKLKTTWLRVPNAPVRIAGTGSRTLGSDNDL